MSANLYVGDAVAIVQLALSLYDKGREARGAPDAFRELLEELDLMTKILWGIQARLRRDESKRDDLLAMVLRRCKDALLSFQPLVDKYRKLADTDHGLWVKRISWALDHKEIEKCHKRFEIAAQRLHLAFLPADRRDTTESPNVPDEISDIDGLSTKDSSTSTKNVRSTDESGTPSSVSPMLVAGSRSNFSLRRASFQPRRHWPHLDIQTAAELGIGNQKSKEYWYSPSSISIHGAEHSHKGRVFSTKQLHSLKLKENREKHNIPHAVYFAFQKASETFGADDNATTWLYHAAWWLIKSRTVWNGLAEKKGKSDLGQTATHIWENTASATQAWLDLCKSSFILEDIVLARDEIGADMDDAVWKDLKGLSDGIDQEFRRWKASPFSSRPEEDVLLQQHVSFEEHWMSPTEDPQHVPKNFDNFDIPQRWLKADPDDAGLDHEKILYRTFVDAQLGNKDLSAKSTGAPYLLVLFCHIGRSELIISLCNLAFTVNLSRCINWSHLMLFEESTRHDGGFEIEFPHQRAVIKFLSNKEHVGFLAHPKAFLSVVKDRGPRPGEVQIFREVLESYQSRDAVIDKQNVSSRPRMNDSYAACELTLYDFCPEESWKTTRRLVLSSDPSTAKPWCTSHWLPLCKIEVQLQAREVVLRWSDYQQLDEKSNGEYGFWYSYLYQPNKPNCSVNLVFKDHVSAESFADTILRPFDTPIKTQHLDLLHNFGSRSTQQRGAVYRLYDIDEESNKGRLAIVLVSNRPNFLQVTDVYFVHRDVDFFLEKSKEHSVAFPDLGVPDYHSSIRGVARRLDEKIEEPEFAGVEVTQESAQIDFSSNEELFSFMEKLLGWKLKYARKVRSITFDHKWPFLVDSHKQSIVHLFEKKAKQEHARYLRLAIRSTNDNESFWATTSPSQPHLHGRKVILKNVRICKGDEIDTKEMHAVHAASRTQQQPHAERKVVVIFKSNQDAQNFAMEVSNTVDDLNVADEGL